jgi:hypothetical protein
MSSRGERTEIKVNIVGVSSSAFNDEEINVNRDVTRSEMTKTWTIWCGCNSVNFIFWQMLARALLSSLFLSE